MKYPAYRAKNRIWFIKIYLFAGENKTEIFLNKSAQNEYKVKYNINIREINSNE